MFLYGLWCLVLEISTVGEPPDPLHIRDSSSMAFGLFLDYIYRGEKGMDIFNQVGFFEKIWSDLDIC